METEVIENVSNNQVFFNQEAFTGNPKTASIDMLVATELVSKFLKAVDGVADVFTEKEIHDTGYDEQGMRGMVMRGFHTKRSGDVAYITEPGWIESNKIQGTTHGTGYPYDTNVPVIFFGSGIKQGSTAAYHPITEISATLSVLLKIKFPNGCTRQTINELFGE